MIHFRVNGVLNEISVVLNFLFRYLNIEARRNGGSGKVSPLVTFARKEQKSQTSSCEFVCLK